jgi:class 3 adenylate cyclase
MHARDALVALHLPGPAIETLLALLDRPAPGILDPEDTDATIGSAPFYLVLALLASRHRGEVVPALLDELEPRLGELTPYDVGRFWHLRGVEAWRRDSSFQATRALNMSARLLEDEHGARAERYLARVHDCFGQLLHQQGWLGDARREFKRALELRRDDATGAAHTHGNLGRLCLDLGDFEAAREHFTRDLAIVEMIDGTTSSARIQTLSHLAECELRLGAVEHAAQLFARSRELAGKAHDEVGAIHAEVGLARISLARDDAPKALACGHALVDRVMQPSVPERARVALLAAAMKLIADAQLACHQFDLADHSYRDSLKHLGACSASPMQYAEAFRGLASALGGQQERAESARNLRLALRHLDGTAAESLRRDIEVELERASRDSWLLHAAGRFIGQHNIERLLDGGEPGRGEHRRVAVLFSDIRGFTTLAEGQPAEQVIEFLNDFFAHMTRCVERHDGVVDKFIGDAVMAVFPLDEAGTSRAIDAALAMREELARLNRYLPVALTIGTGIHSGDVIAGLVGSAQKREYTVIGDVVNTASRLEGMSKQLGATLLVSAVVNPDLATHLVRPLGTYAPKGKHTGLAVFDVMGLRDKSPASKAMDVEIRETTRALEQLERGDFGLAAFAFERLMQHSPLPRSTGYRFLAAKARELAAAPPAQWTGSIALAEK